MNSQALTKPFHNSAHGSSRPARSSSASSEFISSQHPYRTVLASSWVLRLCSPIHTLLPLAGLFHPSFLPPRGQRQLLSSMSSCKALQAELLGFTSSAGFSHNCFSPFRERKGKSRWKPHVSCQLDLAADQGTWREKTKSAVTTAPERLWLLYGIGMSARLSRFAKAFP